MATETENLETARSQIAQQIADMTADPKPTYSIGGQSISWGEHFNNLIKAHEDLTRAIQRLNSPFWKVSRAKA